MELTAKLGAEPLDRLVKGMMPEGSVFQQCSTCAIGALCVKYREGAPCAFSEAFRDTPTQTMNDVATAMAMLIEENSARFRMARAIEQSLGGGMPTKETTELAHVLSDQLQALGKIMKSTKTARLKGDGEGILAKIFGDLLPQPIELSADDAATSHPDADADPQSTAALPPASDPDDLTKMLDAADAVRLPVADGGGDQSGGPSRLATIPDPVSRKG